MEPLKATRPSNRQKARSQGVVNGFSGLAVSSGILSVCFQVFAWAVRRESDYELHASWIGSYVASAALIFAVATIRVIFAKK